MPKKRMTDVERVDNCIYYNNMVIDYLQRESLKEALLRLVARVRKDEGERNAKAD